MNSAHSDATRKTDWALRWIPAPLIDTYIKNSAHSDAMRKTDWAPVPSQHSILDVLSSVYPRRVFAVVKDISRFFSGSFASLDARAVGLIGMNARLTIWS